MRSLRVFLYLVLLACPSLVQAGDASAWPQFRRDSLRSGDNPDASLEFPLQRTTAIRLPAPIYASPAVVDGLVYVQDARGHVVCVDSRKNQVMWTASIGGVNNLSSPAIADGKVFIGSTAGYLAILDANTGKVLERVPAPGGVIAAPALANGSVYFSTFAGKLAKIDYTGKVVWSYDGGRISITEFAVRDKELLFFAGTANTVVHHLRDLGDKVEVISKTPVPGQCCPVGGPVFVGDKAFAFQSFESEYGRFYYAPLAEPFKKGTGTAQDVSDSRVTPAVRGSLLYRGDKCFQTAGGFKQVWRADPATLYDGGFHSSPALAKNVLVLGTELGALHFLPVEGKGIKQQSLWHYTISNAGQANGSISSSPAVVNGCVFFGGEDGVLYGLSKGPEAPVVDARIPPEKEQAQPKLAGAEWPAPGGDMGYSLVSSDRAIKPPFQIEWQSRIWCSFKGPLIVADNKVFCTGRLGTLMALDAGSGAILWKTHHAGVESRPAGTYAEGKFLVMRVRNGQGDSPFTSGSSGGPEGEGLWCHDAATGKTLWHKPMSFRYHFNTDGVATYNGKVFVQQLGKDDALQFVAYALDSGRELWRADVPDLSASKAEKPHPDVKPVPKGYKLPPRFSGVMAGGLWCVSVSDRGTAALDPDTGRVVWSTKDKFIFARSRLAARNDVLVVFNLQGDHALDARTGKVLWSNQNKNAYAQALSDLYLESQGKKDVHVSGRCWWPVLVNGVWYSHSPSSSNNRLIAVEGTKTIWSFDFLSNACPSPSPAYGRLYYSPSAEGVIYCFTNAQQKGRLDDGQ